MNVFTYTLTVGVCVALYFYIRLVILPICQAYDHLLGRIAAIILSLYFVVFAGLVGLGLLYLINQIIVRNF